MTAHDNPPEAPAGAPQIAAPLPPTTNVVGRVALALAVAGFIFACIPGALIVGWVLLPAAFVVGIVGVTRKEQRKAASILAIVLSVVGTIVGTIVFLTVATDAVSEALDGAGGGETTAVSPSDDAEDARDPDPDPDTDAGEGGDEPADTPADAGTRDNPYAFGDAVANDDWTVEVTAFDADANAEIAAASEFNDAPGDGMRWVIADVAVTYTGVDSGSVLGVGVDYVAADGTVVSAFDTVVMGLEPDFDSLAELYEGATEDGRLAFLVPESVDGLLRITPGLFADEAFVALPQG